MYSVFVTGLRKAGFHDDELGFFHLHIACDDEHAETLEQMMLSYASESRWMDVCKRAMNRALNLRLEFFERMADALQHRRLDTTVARSTTASRCAHSRRNRLISATAQPTLVRRCIPTRSRPPASTSRSRGFR